MSTIKSSAENLTLNADGANNDVIIQSNGSTKVTVDGATGNVGVGTTAPAKQLELSGNNSYTSAVRFAYGQSGYTADLGYKSDGNTVYLTITDGGTAVDVLKAQYAGNVTLPTGNLVIGTSGKGIDFSANSHASGMSSELLDSYEEGTWTPTFDGATISAVHTIAHYTKIGRQVFFNYYSDTLTISSASGNAIVLGLPFTTSSIPRNYGLFTYQHGNAVDGGSRGGYIQKNGTYMYFIDTNNTSGASYVNGTKKMMIAGSYFVD